MKIIRPKIKKGKGLFVRRAKVVPTKRKKELLAPVKQWRITTQTVMCARTPEQVRALVKELYWLHEIVKMEAINATVAVRKAGSKTANGSALRVRVEQAQSRGHESAKQWLKERRIPF